jgi:hypothetical protein
MISPERSAYEDIRRDLDELTRSLKDKIEVYEHKMQVRLTHIKQIKRITSKGSKTLTTPFNISKALSTNKQQNWRPSTRNGEGKDQCTSFFLRFGGDLVLRDGSDGPMQDHIMSSVNKVLDQSQAEY